MAKNRNYTQQQPTTNNQKTSDTTAPEVVETTEVQTGAEAPAVDVVETKQEDVPAPVAPAEEKKIPEPKAPEKEVVVDAPTMEVVEPKFELPKRAAACGEPTTQRGVMMKDMVDKYVANTSPNTRISQADGGKYTTALIRMLTGPSLGAAYEDFKDVMDVYVANVKEHLEGAFARRYALRFIPDVSGVTRAQVALYENIYAAVVQVASVGKAQASKGIDIGKFTAYVDNEQAIANLTEYFKG